MVFDPGLHLNQTIDNNDLCSIFLCSPQGGMRKSNRTNSLVIVSDRTSLIYRDVWKDGVLYYTGSGKVGDQRKDKEPNKTLAESQTNGVTVYLFEVFIKGLYKYRGEVKLVGKPYQEKQRNRMVWIFPVKPTSPVKPD